MKRSIGLALAISISALSAPAWSVCRDSGVQIQILGSGGPADSGGRASASYLLWIDGVSRLLVDAGGGTKNHFYSSGAHLGDLDLIALSHLHPDHSAELPALLWPEGGNYQISGPSGAGVFPSIEEFLDQLIGPGGIYHILGNRTELSVITVDVTASGAIEVWRNGDLVIQGTGVPHGNVPTIGYRVDIGERSVVFASDQTGSDPAFTDFISGADVLVIHMSSTEDATGVIEELHAKPSVWGQMASAAMVGSVVVSHVASSAAANDPFSPEILNESLGFLSENYSGPITVGEDLLCIEVD